MIKSLFCTKQSLVLLPKHCYIIETLFRNYLNFQVPVNLQSAQCLSLLFIKNVRKLSNMDIHKDINSICMFDIKKIKQLCKHLCFWYLFFPDILYHLNIVNINCSAKVTEVTVSIYAYLRYL